MNYISWFIIHALSLTDCVLIVVSFWIVCWILISPYPHTPICVGVSVYFCPVYPPQFA